MALRELYETAVMEEIGKAFVEQLRKKIENLEINSSKENRFKTWREIIHLLKREADLLCAKRYFKMKWYMIYVNNKLQLVELLTPCWGQ